MSVETVLALIGLIIIIGFFGAFLFEKFRIPDVLLLLGCGAVIGHWLSYDTQLFVARFAPYFGAIAIIMILFEGGLSLDVKDIRDQFKNILLLPILTFSLSLAMVALACMSWLGWNVWISLMFGAIIGCTSSAIVIPIVQRCRAGSKIKTLVSMESVFSDTLAIVVLVGLMDLAQGAEMNATTPFGHLSLDVGAAIIVSLPVGLLWLNILEWTKERQFSYLWTFAMLVLVYAGVNWLGASGALAVFFLALIIGNGAYLPRWLVWGKPIASEEQIDSMADQTVKWFHTELTFLIRSFFFVYIGLLFRMEYIQGKYFWLMVGFTAVIGTARIMGIWLMQRKPEPLSRTLIWAFLPRGLVSAVLATLPAAHGVVGSENFLAYTIPVIISTNIIMTIWVMGWEWRNRSTDNSSSVIGDAENSPV